MRRESDKLSLLVLLVLSIGAPALAQSPSTAPATQGAGIASLHALMQLVPANAYPDRAGTWNEVRMEIANAALKEKALGQPATLSLKVARVGKPPEKLGRDELKARGGDIRIEAAAFAANGLLVRQFAYFEPSQLADLAPLREGSAVSVSGTIVQCNVGKTGDKWSLTIVLGRSRMIEPKATPKK